MILTYVEEKAEKLSIEMGFTKYPIDVFQFASHAGINVLPMEMDNDVSGLFIVKEGKPYIVYNQKENQTRVRFTIAHELGHYFLHSKSTPLFVDKVDRLHYRNQDSSSGEIRKEREANSFAAALLMPKKHLIREIEELQNELGINSDRVVNSLAKKFDVSPTAMTIRLSNLGLIEFGLFS